MNALSEALNARQNETTPVERKEVCFEDDDEESGSFFIDGGDGSRTTGTK
jgi:hypothetical protein